MRATRSFLKVEIPEGRLFLNFRKYKVLNVLSIKIFDSSNNTSVYVTTFRGRI